MDDEHAFGRARKATSIGDKSMNVRLGSICATLVMGLLLAGCGSNNSTAVTIAITPVSATVLLGTSVQFIPSVTGSSNAVQWSVNGVVGGNATVGTVDASGLYTAPAVRPVSASGVAVPIIFAVANAAVPNSGSSGSVIELQAGFNLANFAAGNTITIANNSQAGWDGSFIIEAVGTLSNGNFGMQIATPAGLPPNGVGGTATATPNVTITAQVEGTNAVASATVSLDSGIRVSLSEPTCTIGTNETFSFAPFVSVSGTSSGTSNQTVTWSLSGVGSIDPTTGLYTAPSTTGTATITATSVVDPSETATATVTVAAAADPGLTSVSPPTGALGAASQNVYLSGSKFICTTAVLVNGTPLPAGSVSSLSSSSVLVVLPDAVLSTLPASGSTSVTLTFTVERESGPPQPCSPSPCQLVLSPVRPALVASSPDSIPLPSAPFSVTLDGGYFGTTNTAAGVLGNPVVQVQVNGTTIAPQFVNLDRELQLNVSPTALGTTPSPGLYPITVTNTVSCPPSGTPACGTGSPNGSIAAANLAVQPNATPALINSTPVGTTPSSVAINTATGMAVVANQGSNDISILSLGTVASPSVSVSTASLCTGSLGAVAGPGCVASGPISVAVDNIRNLALVANSTSSTLAVVNLSGTPTVTALLTFPSGDPTVGNPFSLTPVAVAINPVSGRALVAFTASQIGATGSNAGAILDLTQTPPALINVVNLNNAATPHIAVSPKLNWALATPGGGGSLSIVDLGRQTTNQLSGISCSPGSTPTSPSVVSVDTATTVGLLAGQPVLVTGVNPSTFDGIFSVTAVSNTSFQYFAKVPCPSSPTSGTGGIVSYALPVASLATSINVRGLSINDETQKALLADPTGGVPAFVFDILDQSSALVNGLSSAFNNVATAMNPLTNIGVIVNNVANEGFVVNPVTPTELSAFNTGTFPVDVAIDPVTNTALIVNQHDNTVSLFRLGGALRSAPQIIQSSFTSAVSGQTSSGATITSSLSTAAQAQDQTVTLIGNFPGTSMLRLDGNCSAFTGSPTITNGGRQLTAALSGSFLATNGPRLYALDVVDSCTTPTTFSNAARLQVIQAVSLVTGDCSNPAPQGVAIDATHNVAVVTEPGCNDVSMVSLSSNTGFSLGTGFGAAPELAVGANPQGVAVYPQAGLAVVADTNSNAASIVDMVNDDVPTAVPTDPLPAGVAVDLGTGNAVLTANGASLVDVFPVSTSTTAPTLTTIGVQQGPTGVAVDPRGEVAVVANSTSNTASVVGLATNTAIFTSNSITFPQGVAFDPMTDTFLVTSEAGNQVIALNPNTVASAAIRVGIGPSSIAYNFETGTLVTANNLSGTVSVVDFIDQTVRGVFSLRSSTQFAVDIHPQTNLAVVADAVDNQLLLVPLPH
jgi:DNA-binding beta-propeller fold protein YncE